jgi:hypothetical protein
LTGPARVPIAADDDGQPGKLRPKTYFDSGEELVKVDVQYPVARWCRCFDRWFARGHQHTR